MNVKEEKRQSLHEAKDFVVFLSDSDKKGSGDISPRCLNETWS